MVNSTVDGVRQKQSASGRAPLGKRGMVGPLCWAAMMMDGYDAVLLGVVIPVLLKRHEWGITVSGATTVGTIGIVGMVVGSLTLGVLTDRLGRRRTIIGSVVLFTIFTVLGAFATSLTAFSVLRFLAGVGLGGCLPTAVAMAGEFEPRSRTSRATSVTMTGYQFGAVLTAGLGIVLIPRFGWQGMFLASAVPALIILPLLIVALPESPAYLMAKGRYDEARAVADHHGLAQVKVEEPARHTIRARQGLSLLLSGPLVRNTVTVFVASFMGLLLIYSLNTWLPQIMLKAINRLDAALTMTMVLNLGAIVGLLVGGRVGDRITPRIAAIGWFAAAGLLLMSLAIRLPLAGMFVLTFLTGVFVFSSQALVFSFLADNTPPQVRATALGMAAGIGRLGGIVGPLMGGMLVARGLAYPQGFFVFGAVGLLGSLAMLCTRPIASRPVAAPHS